MKLVIQNGCRHSVTRKELEPMLALFPTRWNKFVDTIAFYTGQNEEMRTQYFQKEKVLGVFWPRVQQDANERQVAIEEILVSLECISGTGGLCLTRSNRDYLLDKTASVREGCFRLLTTSLIC